MRRNRQPRERATETASRSFRYSGLNVAVFQSASGVDQNVTTLATGSTRERRNVTAAPPRTDAPLWAEPKRPDPRLRETGGQCQEGCPVGDRLLHHTPSAR